MKRASIQQMYYFKLTCYIFVLICGIFGDIFMLVYSKHLFRDYKTIFAIIFFACIIMMFFALTILSLKSTINLIKDYKLLKNKEYISITGKVIGFEKNREPESGMQINDRPIIIILDTSSNDNVNDKIVLNTDDKLVVGEIYKFHYLKHSKIAEVVIEN